MYIKKNLNTVWNIANHPEIAVKSDNPLAKSTVEI